MLFILFNLLFKIIIIISFIVVFRIKKLIRLTKLKNPIGKKSHRRKNPMDEKNPMGEKIPWENRKSHGKMQKSHGNPNLAYKFHSEENAFFEWKQPIINQR